MLLNHIKPLLPTRQSNQLQGKQPLHTKHMKYLVQLLTPQPTRQLKFQVQQRLTLLRKPLPQIKKINYFHQSKSDEFLKFNLNNISNENS